MELSPAYYAPVPASFLESGFPIFAHVFTMGIAIAAVCTVVISVWRGFTAMELTEKEPVAAVVPKNYGGTSNIVEEVDAEN